MKKLVMVGLICVSMVGSVLADATFDVVVPAVPATPSQSVQLKAVITDVSCQFLPPAYTNMQYIVRFQVVKPDGSVLRMDGIRITQSDIVASGDSSISVAMANLGVKVNQILVGYISKVSTNANWIAGKRIEQTPVPLKTAPRKPVIKVITK